MANEQPGNKPGKLSTNADTPSGNVANRAKGANKPAPTPYEPVNPDVEKNLKDTDKVLVHDKQPAGGLKSPRPFTVTYKGYKSMMQNHGASAKYELQGKYNPKTKKAFGASGTDEQIPDLRDERDPAVGNGTEGEGGNGGGEAGGTSGTGTEGGAGAENVGAAPTQQTKTNPMPGTTDTQRPAMRTGATGNAANGGK